MTTILIRGVKVIDASSPHHLDTVDIFIDQGNIQSIGKNLTHRAEQEIDLKGAHVSAGWTDIFADYKEPGYEHKETIATGLKSAAAGGFTAVMTTPDTLPAVSSKSIVQYLIRQAKGQPVSLHPAGTISKELEGKTLAEMLDMHAHGAIAFSDGWKPVQNPNLMLKALEYIKAFDGILIQIPMDASLASGGLMHEGEESTKLGMPGIPRLAETLHLHRDIELLRYTDSRLHITGVSAAESVEMIRKAKTDGLSISCSVTPYHLALNDEVLRNYDAVYKVMPPIRTEADRLALIAGVKDGTIDCITSHHRPQDWDAKAKEFEYASEGMNVQELCFAIAYNALKDHVPLERIIDALSAAPARIFGLKKEGLREGTAADLSIFDPSGITECNTMHSLSGNNPFLGKKMQGKVLGIISNGYILFNSNQKL